MLCEEGLCKVNQIWNHTVIGICPEAGKLKAITCLSLTCSPLLMFLSCAIPSSAVGIILCICSIGYNKNLDILIQSAPRPKRIPLVTVDLVECLHGWQHLYAFSAQYAQAADPLTNTVTS